VGNDTLENAQVMLHSRQTSLKMGRTDHEGRFKVINVPEGTYTLTVTWRQSYVRKPTKWPEDTKLEVHRPLEVHKNMDLDIDVGDGRSP
jgi:hypothetical protein